MKTIQTTQTHCADCGQLLPTPPDTGASGYAVLPNGNHICYPCADKRQIEDLKDRSKPFVAYLTHNKITWRREITTWTGGVLMHVSHSRPCRLTRRSHWHDSKGYMSIHAVDVHGGHWAGRGSDGVAIKLRPVKGN